MPVSNGKTKVILHGFAAHYFSGIIVAEGERVFGVRSFVTDFFDTGEVFLGHDVRWFVFN